MPRRTSRAVNATGLLAVLALALVLAVKLPAAGAEDSGAKDCRHRWRTAEWPPRYHKRLDRGVHYVRRVAACPVTQGTQPIPHPSPTAEPTTPTDTTSAASGEPPQTATAVQVPKPGKTPPGKASRSSENPPSKTGKPNPPQDTGGPSQNPPQGTGGPSQTPPQWSGEPTAPIQPTPSETWSGQTETPRAGVGRLGIAGSQPTAPPEQPPEADTDTPTASTASTTASAAMSSASVAPSPVTSTATPTTASSQSASVLPSTAAAAPALSTVPADETTLSRYPPRPGGPPTLTGSAGIVGSASAPSGAPGSSAAQNPSQGVVTGSPAALSSGATQPRSFKTPRRLPGGDAALLTGLIIGFTAAVGGVVFLAGHRGSRRKY